VAEEVSDTPVSACVEVAIVHVDAREGVAPLRKVVCGVVRRFYIRVMLGDKCYEREEDKE
jgi:hypothetical protein